MHRRSLQKVCQKFVGYLEGHGKIGEKIVEYWEELDAFCSFAWFSTVDSINSQGFEIVEISTVIEIIKCVKFNPHFYYLIRGRLLMIWGSREGGRGDKNITVDHSWEGGLIQDVLYIVFTKLYLWFQRIHITRDAHFSYYKIRKNTLNKIRKKPYTEAMIYKIFYGWFTHTLRAKFE